MMVIDLSHLPDLNRGPLLYESIALPAELRWRLVGRVRVELTGPHGQQIYSLPPHPTGLPALFFFYNTTEVNSIILFVDIGARLFEPEGDTVIGL